MTNDQQQTTSRADAARMLWIDGVGGYMVVAGQEWLIGGLGGGDAVDIRIQGDLSRRAAAIRRQGSDYVLQPLAESHLDGRTLDRPELLRDGSVFQLGGSVTLRFSKPHPLSASARLDFVSRHRTQPRSDAIILLADTCIIGPSAKAHIVCPRWESDSVMFLGGGNWQLRQDQPIRIDGQEVGQRATLPANCVAESSAMRLSLEAIS